MKRVPKLRNIPDAGDWAGYETDLDVRAAHKLFFGKSYSDCVRYFGGVQSIGHADELLFMPRRAFQYYVFSFAEFVTSEEAKSDSDSASPFLRLLVNREKKDPGSVAQIYKELLPSVQFVANHQEWYEAPPDVYGRFSDLAEELAELCEAPHARV